MKRTLTIFAVLSLVMASGALAADYGWSVSGSSTDPSQNTAAPIFGLVPLFLWLDCNTVDGVSAAEMDLSGVLAGAGLSVTPVNGFLNAGTPNALLLAVGGCPSGPIVAANLGALDFVGTGGDMCITGANVTVDCDTVNPQAHPHAVTGFDNSGAAPCGTDECGDVSVEPSSWGTIKGLYR